MCFFTIFLEFVDFIKQKRMRNQNCCYSSYSYSNYSNSDSEPFSIEKVRGKFPIPPEEDFDEEELDAEVAQQHALWEALNDALSPTNRNIDLRSPSKGKSPSASDCTIQKARNAELSQTIYTLPGFACQGPLGQIIELYLQAELVARKITAFHAFDINLSTPNDLDIRNILAALKFFKISPQISKVDLNWIFSGGQGKRGEKSIRQLRNGYFHELNNDDRKEIEQFRDTFLRYLNQFNSIQIKQFKC